MTEMRPLRWHDLPLAYRLVGRGQSFDAHLQLIVGEDHLRHVQLTGAGRTQVCVLRRQGKSSGLGVLYYPDGGQHARLAYLSPSLDAGTDEELWLSMLDGLAAMAGQRGAVNIAAEVDDLSPALEILRQADFAIYARQEVWLREPHSLEGPIIALREVKHDEMPNLMALYGVLVPPLIKQVEPKPIAADVCYVVDGRNGPCAMVAAYRGARKSLAEVYLHPEIELEAQPVINGALAVLQGETQPVYLRVRRYMGWLDSALHALGFMPVASQAVMVRHTAVHLRAEQGVRAVPNIEGVLAPTPIADLHSIMAPGGGAESLN